MKRIVLLIILLALVMLAGCSKKEQTMTDFIPTQAPTEEDAKAEPTAEATKNDGEASTDTTEAASGEDTATKDTTDTSAEAPTPKAVHVGETTTKYVKLDQYDAILNIRSTPSKDGEVVGFLVHTEKIEVIEIKDGWASFVYNGAVCYVSSDFLVDTRPEYIDPPTLTPSPTPAAKTPTPKPAATTTDGNAAPPEI